jgi:hypothetical protein
VLRTQRNGHVVYEFEPACHLGAKLAGVHWWHKSRAHAAELTAGYYNTRERDGYAPLMKILAKHGARVSFTCVEMRDCEHPPEGRCSPQGKKQCQLANFHSSAALVVSKPFFPLQHRLLLMSTCLRCPCFNATSLHQCHSFYCCDGHMYNICWTRPQPASALQGCCSR